MSHKKSSKLPLIYLCLITALAYVPIAVAVAYSFNNSKSNLVWSGFTLKWYVQVFKDFSIRQAVANSLFIGLASSVLSAFVAVSGSLAFRHSHGVLASLAKKIQMVPLMIPEIVLASSYLVFFRFTGLKFGFLTVVLGHTSFCVPYIFLQVQSRVEAMDDTQTNAARLMGASPLRAFLDVTLPYLSPALISGLFLSFAMSLDDVIISMFVTGTGNTTIAMKIYSQVKTSVTPKVNALCTMLLILSVVCMVVAGKAGRTRVSGE